MKFYFSLFKKILAYLTSALLILPVISVYTKFNKVRIIFVPDLPQGFLAHSVDLFFRKHQISNVNDNTKTLLLARSIVYIDGYPKSQLLLMFKRLSIGVDNVYMSTNSFMQYIMYKTKCVYGHAVIFDKLTTNFYEYEYISALPMASFTCSEISSARNQLKLFGIDVVNDKIVSVFARDSDYKNHIDKKEGLDYRNTDINNFIPAIQYLVKKGYKVVRVGSYSTKEVQYTDKSFFDYTMSGKTNTLLDIFLLYISKFVVGTSSGAIDPAHLFNTPVTYIDCTTFYSLPFSNKYYDSYIPKKIVNSETGRVVKFSSIVDKIKPKKDVRWAVDEEYLQDEFGLRFIDNTENEILEGVIEIESRLLCNQFVDVENSDIAKLYYQYLDKNKSNSLRTLPSLTWLEKNIDLYID
mgnify:CR=1 FL=1